MAFGAVVVFVALYDFLAVPTVYETIKLFALVPLIFFVTALAEIFADFLKFLIVHVWFPLGIVQVLPPAVTTDDNGRNWLVP